MRSLFPEAIAQKYQADDAKVLQTGVVLRGIEELRLPDHKRQWIERIKAPVRDAKGAIVGVQVIFWDVSERVATAESLNLEQRLLTSLMDSIPDAVYFKDRESRFLRISRAMADKFGLAWTGGGDREDGCRYLFVGTCRAGFARRTKDHAHRRAVGRKN